VGRIGLHSQVQILKVPALTQSANNFQSESIEETRLLICRLVYWRVKSYEIDMDHEDAAYVELREKARRFVDDADPPSLVWPSLLATGEVLAKSRAAQGSSL
jgi:hypothetical protein